MRRTFLLGLLVVFGGAFVAYGKEGNKKLKSFEQETKTPQTFETGTRSGKVVDAVTNEPIIGAVVAYTWDVRMAGSESGIEKAVQYEVTTDENGSYFIPNQKITIAGASAPDLEPEHVFVYKKGYLWYMVYDNQAWCFMEREPNSKYQKENNIVKLEPWNEKFSHSKHMGVFRNKKMREYIGPKLEEAVSEEWEIVQEEKLAKGASRSKTLLIRRRITKDMRAFQEGKIDKAEYIEKLKTYLATDNVEVINLVAVELYRRGDESGIEPLIKALKDNLHREEFNWALKGLKIITDRDDLNRTEVISERLEIVKDIENWWQNNKGRESLWQSNEERRQTESLSRLLLSSVSDKEKGEVLNDLFQSENKSAAPYLVQFLSLKGQNAGLYQATLYLLSKIGDESAVEAVKPMLYHPDIYVRRQAALTLNALGDQNGVPVMIASLKSKSKNTRSVANAVLKECTGQDFTEGRSLRMLPINEEKAVIEKWQVWWEKNKSPVNANEIRDFSKILDAESEVMARRYAAIEDSQEDKPGLPIFDDPKRSPVAAFEEFKAALLADDVDKALSYFSPHLKETYAEIFQQLGLHRQDYAKGLGKIYFDMKLDNVYYYEMVTEQDEGLISFPIRFVQDHNSKWLITEF